jgi:hypothetical protein
MDLSIGMLSWRALGTLENTVCGEYRHRQRPATPSRSGPKRIFPVPGKRLICGSAILKNYYVFALVRHPLHRVCSLYNFIGRVVDRWAAELGVAPENLAQRVAENPDLPEKIPALAWSATVAFLQTAGFSEFLRNEHAKRDMAYSSQVSRPLGAETYKLEDMKENLPALGRKLGFDFDFPHLNRRGRVFVTPDAVSSEDRSYIEKLYAEDYAALGY